MEAPRYWFKQRRYGYGWQPATWEGWLVIGIYIVVVFFLVTRLIDFEGEVVNRFIGPFGVATLVLILISWRTGEPLKWRWGDDKDDDSKPT